MGFALFENFVYAFDVYSVFLITEQNIFDANLASIVTLFVRTLKDFFTGHHYWTAIFGAIYVLFKKNVNFDIEDVFQWKVIIGYFISVILHMSWNASTFIGSYFVQFIIQSLICILSVLALIFLINIGINQTKVMGIYESYQTDTRFNEDEIK